MTLNLKNTYWSNSGHWQQLADALTVMIPPAFSVPEPKKNRALERFRAASNCYHDLYNNGLRNRAVEFRRVFGFSAGYRSIDNAKVREIEKRMSEIIISAAEEQGIVS